MELLAMTEYELAATELKVEKALVHWQWSSWSSKRGSDRWVVGHLSSSPSQAFSPRLSFTFTVWSHDAFRFTLLLLSQLTHSERMLHAARETNTAAAAAACLPRWLLLPLSPAEYGEMPTADRWAPLTDSDGDGKEGKIIPQWQGKQSMLLRGGLSERKGREGL